MRYVAIRFIYARLITFLAMESQFGCAKAARHTFFADVRAVFTDETVETHKDIFVFRIISITPLAFESAGVSVQRQYG